MKVKLMFNLNNLPDTVVQMVDLPSIPQVGSAIIFKMEEIPEEKKDECDDFLYKCNMGVSSIFEVYDIWYTPYSDIVTVLIKES